MVKNKNRPAPGWEGTVFGLGFVGFLDLEDLNIGIFYAEVGGGIVRGEPDVEMVFASVRVHSVFYCEYFVAVKLGYFYSGAEWQ